MSKHLMMLKPLTASSGLASSFLRPPSWLLWGKRRWSLYAGCPPLWQ